jgi:hypothetical protein
MKVKGKTLKQHLSKVNRQLNWLERLVKASKTLNRLARFFTLDARCLKPCKTLRLTYSGKATTHAEYLKDVGKVAKILNTTFSDDGLGVGKFGRITLNVRLVGPFTGPDLPPEAETILPEVNVIKITASLPMPTAEVA